MVNKLIIKKPIITEKSLYDAAAGIFAFEVDKNATKGKIKQAIEEMFKVHVKRLSTVITKGKKRLVGRKRIAIMEPAKKKARVKLQNGEKIDLFEVGKSS